MKGCKRTTHTLDTRKTDFRVLDMGFDSTIFCKNRVNFSNIKILSFYCAKIENKIEKRDSGTPIKEREKEEQEEKDMGLRLKIEGNESVNLRETSITKITFGADIPHDSNARSTDLGSTALIEGKILAAVDGEAADDTSKIARWALVPAENADCYRRITIDVVNASQIVRQISIPNAFVVDYEEDYTDDTGAGVFRLLVKQKKDKMTALKFEGGFGGE